ncbi:MAG: 2-isopropylmalate synthase [Clostridia bacterium]|nr:2-isopropylmalate synthase [Clostridia bacterium]
MMDASKYRRGYFLVDEKYNAWVKRDYIDHAPVWCSVDMRDGNQSLVIPMSLPEKLEYFDTLVKVGFREIEVGFPASSDTEYEFIRTLIDEDRIPDGVCIQVLTQCREHIIRRTFEACRGAKSAIIHFYNSTSAAQREQVFEKSKDEIKALAVEGASLVKRLAAEYEGNFRFEYSPESFTGTEPSFALEVCNAVLDVLDPTEENNVIINLPVTVEMSLPHVYASQVMYMSENLKYREHVTLSLHPHNDRGTGVADTELALLAGADRVEGTLFGNGERTGNVDIITLALNMYSHGVDPGLDLGDIPALVAKYEKCTRMQVYDRAPYAGALVFAAFSGSHQDAIAKSMKYREKNGISEWNVPYIPIDPTDIGRTYDADVIRVNSQSGKGGIGYILESTYGYSLPAKMREELSYLCKSVADREHRELLAEDILSIFTENYLSIKTEITVSKFDFVRDIDTVHLSVTFVRDGVKTSLEADGNGSLSAMNNALRAYTGYEYKLQVYSQHSMQGDGSRSVAASYIGLETPDGKMFWGAGTHTDVMRANTKALLSAFHNMTKK